jgi:hypothetical protein
MPDRPNIDMGLAPLKLRLRHRSLLLFFNHETVTERPMDGTTRTTPNTVSIALSGQLFKLKATTSPVADDRSDRFKRSFMYDLVRIKLRFLSGAQ